MLNIELIQGTISELEKEETTFSTCEKLASLYVIRDHFKQDTESKEIFPNYRRYCELKTKYQMHEIGKEPMLDSFQSVVHEIEAFLSVLYSSTDTQEEREILSNILRRNTF